MHSDFLIVNGIAVVLIIFVLWWFFGSNPEAFWSDGKPVTVYVRDGNYQPSLIKIHAGQVTKIVFIREDPSFCSETVFFPELKISYSLPLNKPVEVTIPPLDSGEITFTCPMAMLSGKITIV